MSNQLKMMVGVAVFAMLALAGALGAFVVSTAQPVEAQEAPSATRSFSPMTVAPGGTVTVTLEHANTAGIGRITEMIPAGFTYDSSSLASGNVDTSDMAAPVFTLFGAPASFTYDVTASMTEGDYTFSGTLRSGDPPADYDVGGYDTVTVSAGGSGNGAERMYGSVRALPEDPGAATQITVKFPTAHELAIDESIVLEVSDDLGVPDSIAAGNASISDGTNTASPRSVVVETDDVAERFKITLFIGDMSDADGAQDLNSGNITVTLRQEAGITNRTEGGDDDWFAYTSQDTFDEDMHQITDVYRVPRLVELSSYGDARGEDITVDRQGLQERHHGPFLARRRQGTGCINGGEVTLCSATASGDDIAECSFTLSNPPFVGGTGLVDHGDHYDIIDMEKGANYINAVDGRNNKANNGGEKSTNSELPVIELEPSMSASPTQGSPGDNVNIQLYDFNNGDMVSKIDFGRDFEVCDADDDTTRTILRQRNQRRQGGRRRRRAQLQLRDSQRHHPGHPADEDLRRPRQTILEARDVDDNFTVGLGGLQVSSTDVLPNQRISISGSGFTTSRGQASAYIGACQRHTQRQRQLLRRLRSASGPPGRYPD